MLEKEVLLNMIKQLENNNIEEEFRNLIENDDLFEPVEIPEEKKFRSLKGKALYIAS